MNARLTATHSKNRTGASVIAVNVACMRSNDNKISDGYRERAPIEVEVFKSYENVVAQGVAVRCIVWLGLGLRNSFLDRVFCICFDRIVMSHHESFEIQGE